MGFVDYLAQVPEISKRIEIGRWRTHMSFGPYTIGTYQPT